MYTGFCLGEEGIVEDSSGIIIIEYVYSCAYIYMYAVHNNGQEALNTTYM